MNPNPSSARKRKPRCRPRVGSTGGAHSCPGGISSSGKGATGSTGPGGAASTYWATAGLLESTPAAATIQMARRFMPEDPAIACPGIRPGGVHSPALPPRGRFGQEVGASGKAPGPAPAADSSPTAPPRRQGRSTMTATRNPNHDADVIVIGSGMGGLATAALLARLHGRKVLVLERHFRAGGFTHTFTRRGGFAWDVGVHYVGEMGRPGHDAQTPCRWPPAARFTGRGCPRPTTGWSSRASSSACAPARRTSAPTSTPPSRPRGGPSTGSSPTWTGRLPG